MRRQASFGLLGPFLGWLVFVAMLTPKLLTGPRFDGGLQFFGMALLACYVFGTLPLLAIAGVDYLLARSYWRILVCGVVGFVAAYTAIYLAAQGGPEKDFLQYQFFLGLMGGVPAAVCSWLSGDNRKLKR